MEIGNLDSEKASYYTVALKLDWQIEVNYGVWKLKCTGLKPDL